MEITSLDLSILMDELKVLEEGFVQKVYQRKEELSLEIYVPGDEKKRLIVGPHYAFLSNYKRDNPMNPPGFCMELRKHLSRVDRIEQKGFDRIVEIHSGDVKLVCETFGKGNLILVKDGKIIGALRQIDFSDRSIVVGEDYVAPDPTQDPRELEDIFEVMDGELVRSLASDLSLGGTYAEEICSRTDIDKSIEVEDMTETQKDSIRETYQKMIVDRNEIEPVLYKDDDGPVRAAPFPLNNYSEYEQEEFEQFSRALDEYFYRIQSKKEKQKKREKYNEKRQGLEKQLEQQQRKIEGLGKSSEQNRARAEIIYENYGVLDEIKKAVEKGMEEKGWKAMEKTLKEAEQEPADKIKGFNEQEEFVTVAVAGDNIKLEPGKNLEATASEYYDKAKESESKIERVKEAMKETERKLEEIGEEDIEVEDSMKDKTKKRSKKWFEKYRWFHSSEDYLICIGRDATTNETLVKKHMEKNDLYFHADFDGAPSVVVKDGQEAGEATREEAAKAAITFSKTWKAGIGADSAYYVKPEQVTKNPESGEYLSKGGFVIRGDREYMHNVKVDAVMGVYEIDGIDVPICGPESAIEENSPITIKLKPGRRKKSDVAKEINRKFADEGHEVDLDYIVRALPPGKSEVE